MKTSKWFWLVGFAIIFSTTIIISTPAQSKTINESVTSNPSGAEIIWGKTQKSMEHTQLKTPFSKQIDAKSWEPWCYQVKKECYLDSVVVCRPEDFGDRNVNFNLKPLEITIGSQWQGWDIYWGPSPENLILSGFKSPHIISCLAITANQGKKYFLMEYNNERSSGIFFYKSLLGYYYQQNGEYEKAISLFHESIKEFPSDYYAHLGIVDCYFKLRDFDNTIKWYLKIIELVPSKAKNIYSMISILYAGINQCETAENYLNKASEFLSDEDKATEAFISTKEIIYKCFLQIERERFQEKLRKPEK